MKNLEELRQRAERAFQAIETGFAESGSGGLETQVEELRVELEAEREARSRLDESASAMRDSYEAQLNQAREVVGELENERTKLEERLQEARTGHSAKDGAAQAQPDAHEAERASQEVQRLRDALDAQNAVTLSVNRTNDELRASLRALREAEAEGIDADLINDTLLTELEALRTAQDSDRAEYDEVLKALQPLIEETQNA